MEPDGPTVVEVEINGGSTARRSLKRWGKGKDRWFIELPDDACRIGGIETGDRIRITMRPAADGLPVELQTLIDNDEVALATWESMTPSRRRMLCEHVFAAKRPITRERRAIKALLGKE